jgi:hypothetical protein
MTNTIKFKYVPICKKQNGKCKCKDPGKGWILVRDLLITCKITRYMG